MDQRIAVYLARRREQERRVVRAREVELVRERAVREVLDLVPVSPAGGTEPDQVVPAVAPEAVDRDDVRERDDRDRRRREKRYRR